MSFEKILEELKTLKDVRPEICEKIKSHNLPVIIFGAGIMAKQITPYLSNFGVEIAGYAVDGDYYKPNQTYLNRPIYDFDEISKYPDKYVFILGFNDDARDIAPVVKFINSKDFIHYEIIDLGLAQNLKSNYISANREKFAEIFYWLTDELSKKTMIEFLRLKITYDLKCNFKVYHPSQYFNEVTNGVRTPNRGGVRGLRRV